MNILPKERPIREILSSKKQYLIPRFQREYSWEKKHYREFIEDMIQNIETKDGNLTQTPYFMGTMLFVGDRNSNMNVPVQVVDGQQRLTTITILFSVLSQIFKEIGSTVLGERIFDYIMSEDDNGDKVRVLKTVSSYPYFSYYIQDPNKENQNEALTEEEKAIKETYEYFYRILQESHLRSLFKKLGKDVKGVKYENLLKLVRDQVLDSSVIEIMTTDKKVANALFEILNAKGKQLSSIDLIKNKIFEVLDETEPADFAQVTWKEINDCLNSGTETAGMATFMRHYWASKYKSVAKANLYDTFKATIKDKKEYKDFMKDLLQNVKAYRKITNPSRTDYNNRKEYFWLVQSLNAFRSYFNLVQVRVPLLSLFDAKERGVIDTKTLKDIILYMENFHFAYTAVLSKSTNRIEPHYSKFAIALRQASDKASAKIIINELKKTIDSHFPAYKDFEKGFVSLVFSKQEHPSNVKTKYALFKICSYFENQELFAEDGSVEHIISENDGPTLKIGNLILLEQKLNGEADNETFINKISVYKKSKYKWISEFMSNHPTWAETDIDARSKHLAEIYYTKIIKRKK